MFPKMYCIIPRVHIYTLCLSLFNILMGVETFPEPSSAGNEQYTSTSKLKFSSTISGLEMGREMDILVHAVTVIILH